MTASLKIPFELGVTLWVPSRSPREEWVECPECCGTKVIRMIKGNGEEVSLDCNFCSRGYMPPEGRIKKMIAQSTPEQFKPIRICGMNGSVFHYTEAREGSTCYSFRSSDEIFATEEECQRRCDEINETHEKNEADRVLHNIQQSRSRLSHSSHYWSRQATRLQKEADAARARCNRLKEEKKNNAET